MLIYSAEGVTNTGNNSLRITKAICGVLVKSEKTMQQIASGTETITIEIERQNGNNTVVCQQLPLADFILGGVFGQSAVFSDVAYATAAKVNLSQSGMGVALRADETLLIRMDGLDTTASYLLSGIEEPNAIDFVRHYDKKQLVGGETVRRFECEEYESCIITNYTLVLDVTIEYQNGKSAKFTTDEFIAISADIDPILSISEAGVVKTKLTNKMCFPLIGVKSIEINKESATVMPIVFLNEKESL